MLPTVNTLVATPPPQISLVATTIPETSALRAPFDTVPPPVSSAQIYNNARGNSATFSVGEELPAPPVTDSAAFVLPARGFPAGSIASSQILFMAQILGQTPSLEVQSMASEYDKMIVLSYVKYKPSNATLPPPAPAGLFGRILEQGGKAPVVVPVAVDVPQAAEPAAESVAASASVNVPAPRPTPSQSARAQATATNSENETEAPAEAVSFSTPPLPIAALRAYAATAQRNATLNKELAADSV